MKRAPPVSVLLPVRDAASTLSECLASLSAQTLREHEVVAVDDGSTDGSGEILQRAAAGDGRLVVVHTPARGLVEALNAALERARAPLLARMDADDRAHPQRLELQRARLGREPALSILGCRVAHEPSARGRGQRSGMADYVRWSNALLDHEAMMADLLVESPLVHPSVMLRAELLRRLHGYRLFDGPEDYDLWLRAAAAGARFAKLPQVLLDWRDGAERLTRRDPRYAADRFRRLKLLALERVHLRPGRPVVVWGAGRSGKAWARALLASGHELAAFVEVDPRKLGQRIHGARVVPCVAAGRFPHALHLAAVGQTEARARIRVEAARLGLREGRDLVAVA